MFTVRHATPEEWPTIQATWADIAFEPSHEGDIVLVALDSEGVRIGQGRLVPMGDGHVELGGMWVRDDWRGRGVAAAIVRALLEAAGERVVWCIPWAELADYYRGLGLRESPSEDTAPPGVRAKIARCRACYPREVALLRRG
jgi:GNAT superfamily N-acetyltransferase